MPEEFINTDIIETVAETPVEESIEILDTDNSSVVGTVIKGAALVAVGAAAGIGIPKLVNWIKNKKASKIADKTQKVDAVEEIIK